MKLHIVPVMKVLFSCLVVVVAARTGKKGHPSSTMADDNGRNGKKGGGGKKGMSMSGFAPAPTVSSAPSDSFSPSSSQNSAKTVTKNLLDVAVSPSSRLKVKEYPAVARTSR